MTDVFISYKREEREKVILVADRLRALGLDVWFDARLTTGHHFDREIDDHVRKAKCVLVCWSPAALTSDWVRAEAAIGRGRNVIVPVLVEPCEPPVPFNTLQTVSLVGWTGDGEFEGWLRAVERIGALVGRPDLAEAERARGANELETRRIQAMLDAQRREEEQAQRRAESASAERARLEQELSNRGVATPSRNVSPPPPRRSAPTAANAANVSSAWGRNPMVAGAAVLLAIALVGVGAFVFGNNTGIVMGRAAERDEQRAARVAVRQRFSGFWCQGSGYYGRGLELEWASGNTLSTRFQYGLAYELSLFEIGIAGSVLLARDGDVSSERSEYQFQIVADELVVDRRYRSGAEDAAPAGSLHPSIVEARYRRCTEAEARTIGQDPAGTTPAPAPH